MRSVNSARLPLFRSQTQLEILFRLFRTEGEEPMSDLARELKVALSTVHGEVARLEASGLITSRRIGRTRMIRANTEHPAAGPLAEILALTVEPDQVRRRTTTPKTQEKL